MKKLKTLTPKLVWRISKAFPRGGWVDSAIADEVISAEAEKTHLTSTWASSSFDLMSGADVREDDSTTIPAELLDELFDRARPVSTLPQSRSRKP